MRAPYLSSRPYSTRLRVKRLRVGIKGFYSASARRAPRSPQRTSIAPVRACSWATRGRLSAPPYVRRGALGRVAVPWPQGPPSALRAARRAPPQQKSVSGAAMITCMSRGASAALTRRRAVAVEACTHTRNFGHAAIMGRRYAQRVRADGLTGAGSRCPRRSLRCVLCAAVRRRCCAFCLASPSPRLARLPGAARRAARTLRTFTYGCILPACVRGAHHAASVHPPRRDPPPFTTRYASQRLWCVITCHAPPSMSACACCARLRSCSAPSSAVLCPAGQVGFPPTLLQAASARHLRGQRHPG